MKMLRAVSGSLIVLSFLFCVNAVLGQSAERSVLVPPGQEREVTKLFWRDASGKIEGSWVPSAEQIEQLEQVLPTLSQLKSGPALKGVQIRDPKSYYRQYIAIVVKQRKLVYINAACNVDPGSDWRKQLIYVFDGGSCFWRAVYDPASQKFSDLETNGVG